MMRFSVPCFEQLRLFSLATGASLGFLLACGSSSDSGLFSGSAGATSTGGLPSSGGESASGSSKSFGGSSSAGGSSSGGASSGGKATGGSATGGDTAMSSGGASISGGASPTGGADSAGGQSAGAGSGGSVSTGGTGGKATGGKATGGSATGGSATGGSATGGCPAKAVERCDGLDNDCNSMIDEQAACAEKCTGFALSGHGYMVCNVEVTATKAAALCEEQGLRLAWIETASENDDLLQTIEDLGSSGRGSGILEVAIGATDADQEGHWRWGDGVEFWQGDDTGEPVDGAYTNWAEGRPNNSTAERAAGEDCGVLVIDKTDDGDPGQWNDVECANSYGVLCEEP